MKKLLFVSMLFCIMQFANAQEKKEIPKVIEHEIGQFCSGGSLLNARAGVSEDTTIVYYYILEAQTSFKPWGLENVKPEFVLWCTPDLKQKLDSVSNKFREWAKVVHDNNITNMESRTINIEVPFTDYILHNDKRDDFPRIEKCNKKTFRFWLTAKGKPVVGYDLDLIVKLPNRLDKNNSEKLYVYLPFWDDEIYKFADFLEPENVKIRIREGKKDLFAD